MTVIDHHETLDVMQDQVVVLVPGSSTKDRFELFEVSGPEGSGPPPHAHPWQEVYFIEDGRLLVEMDGVAPREVGAGDTVIIPDGAVHRFEVRTTTARFLIATSGGRASKFFTDMSRTVGSVAPGPDSLPAIIEVAKRNGLTSPLFD